jgi:hypothetical protein
VVILRFLVVVLALALGTMAQASVSVQKFAWSPNSGAFELSIDEATQLSGTLERGKTVTVEQGTVHAELHSYEPGDFVAVILSEDSDMTATIALLAPPDYKRMSCLEITENRERAASELEGVFRLMSERRPIWSTPQKRLETLANFFSKGTSEDLDLTTFYDQVENDSLREIPPRRCEGSDTTVATDDSAGTSDKDDPSVKVDKPVDDPRLNPMGNPAYGDWLTRRQKLAVQQHLPGAKPPEERATGGTPISVNQVRRFQPSSQQQGFAQPGFTGNNYQPRM